MIEEISTDGEPCILGVDIYGSRKGEKVTLKVYDADDKTKVFSKRDVIVGSHKTYSVRMPISPTLTIVELEGEGADIEDVSVYEFEDDVSHEYFSREEVNSFIDFAEEFCSDSGELVAGETSYKSDDGVYTIIYRDVITDGGEYVPTPARINQADGVMEVSKEHFLKYTIPMRMAILLHEFAHFYLNDVMEDEIEADDNSLKIYMGLGYPRIDAYNVYLDVFENSPSELNVDRYAALNELIKNHS